VEGCGAIVINITNISNKQFTSNLLSIFIRKENNLLNLQGCKIKRYKLIFIFLARNSLQMNSSFPTFQLYFLNFLSSNL